MIDDKKKKEEFLGALRDCLGIITSACEKIKVSRKTYYQWRKTDEEFAARVDEINDTQIDFVEGILLKKIQDGDTTAAIFYLKTKGRSHGYTDKALPKKDGGKETGFTLDEQKRIKTRIAGEKSALIRKLKAVGRYSELLDPQLDIAAQLIVKRKMLDEEIHNDTKKSVTIEESREGNDRLIIDPRQNLYKEYTKLEQDALRSLGMDANGVPNQSEKSPLEELISEMAKNGKNG